MGSDYWVLPMAENLEIVVAVRPIGDEDYMVVVLVKSVAVVLCVRLVDLKRPLICYAGSNLGVEGVSWKLLNLDPLFAVANKAPTNVVDDLSALGESRIGL